MVFVRSTLWRNLSVVALLGLAALVSRAEEKPPTVRPEIAKPLLAAQELMRAQRFRDALAQIDAADSVSDKSDYERYVVQQFRGLAARGSGDHPGAVRSFEAVLDSGYLPPADQLRFLEAIAGSYYQLKDYVKARAASERYLILGGRSTPVRLILVNASYLTRDFAGAARELEAFIAEEKRDGRNVSEERLRMLASCYLNLKDTRGYVGTLERLLASYPKPDYWADAIARVQAQPDFPDRLVLDALRLQYAVGAPMTADDHLEFARLALRAGLAAEAASVLADGLTQGILGSGSDGADHRRRHQFALRQLADDLSQLAGDQQRAIARAEADRLFSIGQAWAVAGKPEQAIMLMEQAIGWGGLRRPDEAALHLGQAYLLARQPGRAAEVFRRIGTGGGLAALARLWVIHADRLARAAGRN